MVEHASRAGALKNNSALNDRPEWLSPRDISEVFGVGRTKAYEICAALPHIYVGRNIRVHRKTVVKELLEKGRLPEGFGVCCVCLKRCGKLKRHHILCLLVMYKFVDAISCM